MAESNGKPWWKSRTIRFNILLGAGLEVASFLGQEGVVSAETVALVMGVGNILLRLVTKGPVTTKGRRV